MIPVGLGMPWWLDTDVYFSADETRLLAPTRFANSVRTCLRCGEPPGPPTYRLEGAHVANKMSGGRGDGFEGPTAELCYRCHQVDLHGSGQRTLAVRRDTRRPVWLERDPDTGEVTETELRWYG